MGRTWNARNNDATMKVTPEVRASTDLLAACTVLAECSQQFEHEPLKGAMRGAVDMLLAHIECQCRASVEFLLSGLGTSCEPRDVQFDKLWSLRKLGRRSQAANRWILELGGPALIASAVAAHPDYDELKEEAIWLIHDIGGLEAVSEMLSHSSPAVQAAAIWVVYDRAKDRCEQERKKGEEWMEGGRLVILLLDVMSRARSGHVSVEVLWGCCSVLRTLIFTQPCRRNLFLAQGGSEAVLHSLRKGHGAGKDGVELLVAAARLVSVVAEGHLQATQQLCSLGVLQALVGDGLAALHTKAAEDVLWVIGQMSGVSSVVEAMRQASMSPTSLHGGLAVLSEIAWKHVDEVQLATYPQLAPILLQIATACERLNVPKDSGKRSHDDLPLALKSLGGVLHGLAPHVGPGAWSVLDDGVALLGQALGQTSDAIVVQAAAESIGRIAMASHSWQSHLRNLLGTLSSRLRTPTTGNGRMKKYLFWATAAIAGVPAVVHEMQAQKDSAKIQDAALCSMIDLLDENLDGSFSLICPERGVAASLVNQGDQAHVLVAMGVVVEAMRSHCAFLPVQFRGSRALGLLHGLMPGVAEVAPEVMDVVLGALWRHPLEPKVAHGSCSALRTFLEPRRKSDGSVGSDGGVVGRAVDMMRSRGAEASLRQVTQNFRAPKRESDAEYLFDTLENAIFVLCFLDGISETVHTLVAGEGASAHLRASGLKALFELARTFPELFPAPKAAEVAQIAAQLQKGATGGVDVQQHAELLNGLLSRIVQQQGLTTPLVCAHPLPSGDGPSLAAAVVLCT